VDDDDVSSGERRECPGVDGGEPGSEQLSRVKSLVKSMGFI
jgi:hypothetical protein